MRVPNYAVVWCEGGEPHSGRLELGSSELRLLGAGSRTGAVRVRQALSNLVRDQQVWRSAAAWRHCIGGRPRLGEAEYSWARH